MLCAPPFHFQRIKAAVATDIKDVGPGEVRGNHRGNVFPFNVGEISQKMIGRCRYAMQIKVVKPFAQLIDTARQGFPIDTRTSYGAGHRQRGVTWMQRRGGRVYSPGGNTARKLPTNLRPAVCTTDL